MKNLNIKYFIYKYLTFNKQFLKMNTKQLFNDRCLGSFAYHIKLLKKMKEMKILNIVENLFLTNLVNMLVTASVNYVMGQKWLIIVLLFIMTIRTNLFW